MVLRRRRRKRTVAGDGYCAAAGQQQEFVEEACWFTSDEYLDENRIRSRLI